MESDPRRSAPTDLPSANTTAAPPPAAPEPAPVVADRLGSASAGADDEVKPGVEVAAVDFGARMGTIFYVPTGSTPSSTMTTVVWLSDDGTGEK
jgi:hypothetical protein